MRALIYVAVLATALAPAAANAGYICWLDRVTKAGDGVELHFRARELAIFVGQTSKGERRLYRVIDNNASVEDVETHSIGAPTPLVMARGESAFASQLVEDSCTYSVAEREGVLGVALESNYSDPGHNRHNVKAFAPAE